MYKSISFPTVLIRVIEVIFTVVELFILLRIVLKLFGANPETPFVEWVYETTKGVLWPFTNMFPAPLIEGGFVIEFSAIFALIAYAILGYLVIEAIGYVSYSSENRYTEKTTTTVRK